MVFILSDLIFTSNKDYLSGIGNTLKFTIISNIVKLIPALLIAIMLQEGLKGKGLYRTLLYLPSILPFVIIGLVFKSILNYNNGLLNAILDGLHLGILKQKWLSDLGVVWKSIYGVDAWRGIGYVMTIFLAGLNTIPRSTTCMINTTMRQLRSMGQTSGRGFAM